MAKSLYYFTKLFDKFSMWKNMIFQVFKKKGMNDCFIILYWITHQPKIQKWPLRVSNFDGLKKYEYWQWMFWILKYYIESLFTYNSWGLQFISGCTLKRTGLASVTLIYRFNVWYRLLFTFRVNLHWKTNILFYKSIGTDLVVTKKN